MTDPDTRFTFGLIHDICEVLHKHGYERADNSATGAAFEDIWKLVRDFEGKPVRPEVIPASTALPSRP